jgi:hypothetical protein
MSAQEDAEIADSPSLFWFWRGGKPCAYSPVLHLLMGQERFVNGKAG